MKININDQVDETTFNLPTAYIENYFSNFI